MAFSFLLNKRKSSQAPSPPAGQGMLPPAWVLSSQALVVPWLFAGCHSLGPRASHVRFPGNERKLRLHPLAVACSHLALHRLPLTVGAGAPSVATRRLLPRLNHQEPELQDFAAHWGGVPSWWRRRGVHGESCFLACHLNLGLFTIIKRAHSHVTKGAVCFVKSELDNKEQLNHYLRVVLPAFDCGCCTQDAGSCLLTPHHFLRNSVMYCIVLCRRPEDVHDVGDVSKPCQDLRKSQL